MNELLNVSYDNDRITVLARDLYDFLEVKTAYKDWFPRMCKYGFVEGVDFNLLNFEQVQNEGSRTVKRTLTDAQLTIEMAKEISMLQRNERGKQARKYFIELEKQWNNPEMMLSRAVKFADKKIQQLEGKIKRDEPLVKFAHSVTHCKNAILIGELSKLMKQNGIDMGQNRLFDYMRNNGFLIKRNGNDHNLPTQYSMNQGLLKIKESVITDKRGENRLTRTPMVTGKGQIYFINRLAKEQGINLLITRGEDGDYLVERK